MKTFIFLSLILSQIAYSNVQSGQVISADSINSGIAQIGEIKESFLTISQFQQLHGDCWKLMDGASIQGSDLHILTGMSSLPNAVLTGAFLRQAIAGRALGSPEEDSIKAHTHTARMSNNAGSDPNSMVAYNGGTGGNGGISSGSSSYVNTGSTGTETRPKNIAVNMFVKVNNLCNFN